MRVLSLKAGNRDGQIAAEKEFCFWIVRSETSQIGSFPSSYYLTIKPQEIRTCFDFFPLKNYCRFLYVMQSHFQICKHDGYPHCPLL